MSACLFPQWGVGRPGAVSLFVATVALLTSAAVVMAEPAWTRTGDCRGCHIAATQVPAMALVGHDGLADPDGNEALPQLRSFRASRGQLNKKLSVQLAGLDPGDTYNVALVRLSEPGVLTAAQLNYAADCAWSDWESGLDHFYTQATRRNVWGSGPTSFDYSLDISATAAYDFYDLLFVVAGVKAATGERFYGEEHFYLSVAPANWAPVVALTAPANNTNFYAPADVTLSAKAFDPDGSVTKLEFFAGAVRLSEMAAPPYVYTWSRVPVGSYALTARATDNMGTTTTSVMANIVIVPAPPVPGDFDRDGDVDQSDFGHLQTCLSGSSIPLSAGCTDASLDGDIDADGADVALFLRCLTGEGLPGNPDCTR